MMEITEQQLKQVIIDAFNQGLIYNLNFDCPAERYAEYIVNELKQKTLTET